MAKNRLVNTKIWDDDWYIRLDPVEKLMWLYLLTCPYVSLSGCYEVSLRRVAFDTGLDESAIKNVLARFVSDGKLAYVEGWVVLKNFSRYNYFSGDKLERAIKSETKLFPDRVLIEYRKTIDRPNKNKNNNKNRNKNKNTESRGSGFTSINDVINSRKVRK